MSDAVARLNAALEGRYAIERELGEGGMATVYLADDIKHERKVALKVLKPELAAVVGAERFLAEIKVTANLQHPNILPLHDSGEADSFLFYVMPYVEGDTLKDRLAREGQLPVNDAVAIAKDIAEALQAAHEQGVIHRDIKPGNVLISRGKPLISDFGIALALSSAGAGERLTETGLSLGTPYYMSPEQATGDQAVGASTDTYALGCVLYEMLVGEPPYAGSSAQAVLGRIIAGKHISATEERPSVPANVDGAIRKALEKLPADRFVGAQDFGKALADPGFRHGVEVATGTAAGRGQWTPLAISLGALALVFGVVAAWSFLRPQTPMPVERFESPFRDAQEPTGMGGGDFALSPDGSMLVYRGPGEQSGVDQLWVRRWEDLDATPIRGTDGGIQTSVSPDGQGVVFNGENEIKVVSLGGGPVRTLTSGRWPHWGPDGYVYATVDSGFIVRVPSTGGPAEPVTQSAEGDVAHVLNDVLPGAAGALLTVNLGDGFETRVLRLSTGEMERLTGGWYVRYSPTGHIVYLTEDFVLMAARFDPEAMELIGSPVALWESVQGFSISDTGKLFYTGVRGTLGFGRYSPVWVDREGASREIDPGWLLEGQAQRFSLAIAPEGGRLVVSSAGPDGVDLWIKELDSGPLTRLTTVGGVNATWSPDGQYLLFASNRDDMNALWTIRADGSGDAQLVLDDERGIFEGEYSPDGDWLVYRVDPPTYVLGNPDVYAIRPGVDSVGTPLLASEFLEWEATISPDGRWLAYTSDRGGRRDVYVLPFPDGSARYPVSTEGGRAPLWAKRGSELFFRNASNELVSARFSDSDGTFDVIERTTLFALDGYLSSTGGFRMYDVTTDGQSFVMLRQQGDIDAAVPVLVLNFFEELKRLVPGN